MSERNSTISYLLRPDPVSAFEPTSRSAENMLRLSFWGPSEGSIENPISDLETPESEAPV